MIKRSKEESKVYKKKIWKLTREEVLKDDHYECQRCNHNYGDSKEKKRFTRATLVHHNFEVKKHPKWAYMKYVVLNGKKVRNLYSLCNDCHEIVHNHRHSGDLKEMFMTQERFD